MPSKSRRQALRVFYSPRANSDDRKGLEAAFAGKAAFARQMARNGSRSVYSCDCGGKPREYICGIRRTGPTAGEADAACRGKRRQACCGRKAVTAVGLLRQKQPAAANPLWPAAQRLRTGLRLIRAPPSGMGQSATWSCLPAWARLGAEHFQRRMLRVREKSCRSSASWYRP